MIARHSNLQIKEVIARNFFTPALAFARVSAVFFKSAEMNNSNHTIYMIKKTALLLTYVLLTFNVNAQSITKTESAALTDYSEWKESDGIIYVFTVEELKSQSSANSLDVFLLPYNNRIVDYKINFFKKELGVLLEYRTDVKEIMEVLQNNGYHCSYTDAEHNRVTLLANGNLNKVPIKQ